MSGLGDLEGLSALVTGAASPLGRGARPDEIAEVVDSLKASYVTGAVIAADGGRTAV